MAEIGSLEDRLVIDAMNRFDGDPLRSTTADLVALLPGAKVAKAFNTIGAENYATARERGDKAAMLVAGDDPEAKRAAMGPGDGAGFPGGGCRTAREREDPRGHGQGLARACAGARPDRGVRGLAG